MAALPLEELRRQQSQGLHTRALVPKSAGQLKTERERIVARLQLLLNVTIAVALAGVALIAWLPFSPVPHAFRFGVQEVLGVAVFASCLFILHERAELELGLYDYEPVEQTTQGELRALLHRVPEGVSYQEALAADKRTFVTGEVDGIRRRAEAFTPKTLPAADGNTET
ncbi:MULTISPECIES: hypothetical protein [Caballeronia]|jgi:hypothetical protein|uniref:Uncharacterized protein n=1 Tax=Caballeronia zhejiangensis TaxID=871203 RepID=A0A656Q8N0_9BURK|nr:MULTISPECIES: hypothetical protein [Caballeronia]EKS66982.1 hypothetical protein BURK_034089 [Burkholderia sp. SJ98]KDR24920.1 hypothetical protein BG60_33315 [Caballeronia zhejiangensis]MCG7405108.1 hypothetical protein [Caballeronia zhejiangensis]MCI1042319.1 hypothetical protein [Caballeronia zhejiangensis]MDR5768341.1 hypothetical protein [Caballeronia sp. LZ028]